MPSRLIKHNSIKLLNQSIIARHNQSGALIIKHRANNFFIPNKPIAVFNFKQSIQLKDINLRLVISLCMFGANNQQQISICFMVLNLKRNRYGIKQTTLDNIKFQIHAIPNHLIDLDFFG